MTDQNETKVTPTPEEQSKATMADNTTTLLQEAEETTKKMEKMNISFSIWPPTQRTRDAVIKRLIETLSADSVLSKRYGIMPPEEATDVARRIEDEAFSAASGSSSSITADDDGIEILQAYSKEISKRMLDSVKSRSTSSTAPEEEEANTTTTTTDASAHDEESTVQSES